MRTLPVILDAMTSVSTVSTRYSADMDACRRSTKQFDRLLRETDPGPSLWFEEEAEDNKGKVIC